MLTLLSLAEVQDALAVSRPTVMRLVAEGELPTIKIRRRRLVHPDDLAAFIAERRAPRNDDDPADTGPIVRTPAEAVGGDEQS